jgi:hypothetical protein
MRRTCWESARERTHRDDRHVHDDLDLSFGLDAEARVVLDPGLGLHVSSRPFADPVAFVRRIWRGIYTVGVNRHSVAVPWRAAARAR